MIRGILITLITSFACYTAYVYCYCDPRIIYAGNDAKKGWVLWQEKNCQSCHQIYGLGGYMGPDLTNVASLRDEKYLYTFIKYGTGNMPNFHCTDGEVKKMIAWLHWINQTGYARVPIKDVHWTGTYVIDTGK